MGHLALGVVADDLSGAAESAAHALLRVSRSPLLLTPTDTDATPVLTVDTHSRGADPTSAASSVAAAARSVAHADVVVKKVDSLLRGNLAAEITSAATELGRPAVVAVSNPELRRIVRDGVLHVDDVPLADTTLWALEGRAAPASLAAALAPLPVTLVPLGTVRAGGAQLAVALRAVAASGAVAVCDAATDEDLAAVHDASLAAFGRALLVGSGALVAAAVRALPVEEPGVDDVGLVPLPTVRSLLVVLGTRAEAARAQIAQVAPLVARHVVVRPEALLGSAPPALDGLDAADGVTLVTLDPDAPADPAQATRLAAALAEAALPAARRHEGLYLSGGETARALLDRLGVRRLDVVAALDTGTAVSLADDGHVVVTRPGSFGGPDALDRAVAALLGDGAPHPPQHQPEHQPELQRHHRHDAPPEENP